MRKKTISITLGPKAEALFNQVLIKLNEPAAGALPLPATEPAVFARCLLMVGLETYAKTYGIEMNASMTSVD